MSRRKARLHRSIEMCRKQEKENKSLTQEEIRASDDPMGLVISKIVELRKKEETSKRITT